MRKRATNCRLEGAFEGDPSRPFLQNQKSATWLRPALPAAYSRQDMDFTVGAQGSQQPERRDLAVNGNGQSRRQRIAVPQTRAKFGESRFHRGERLP